MKDIQNGIEEKIKLKSDLSEANEKIKNLNLKFKELNKKNEELNDYKIINQKKYDNEIGKKEKENLKLKEQVNKYNEDEKNNLLRIKELEKSLKEFNIKNESLIKEVEKNKSLMNEKENLIKELN